MFKIWSKSDKKTFWDITFPVFADIGKNKPRPGPRATKFILDFFHIFIFYEAIKNSSKESQLKNKALMGVGGDAPLKYIWFEWFSKSQWSCTHPLTIGTFFENFTWIGAILFEVSCSLFSLTSAKNQPRLATRPGWWWNFLFVPYLDLLWPFTNNISSIDQKQRKSLRWGGTLILFGS